MPFSVPPALVACELLLQASKGDDMTKFAIGLVAILALGLAGFEGCEKKVPVDPEVKCADNGGDWQDGKCL
jgi:hypothetical protein